jgi:enoyl-CoA hydratase/carnithine racemase
MLAVRVEIEGEIARLVIDRPEKRNALTPEMLAAMVGLIRTIPESARALLVEGKGAVFCAGFDLSLCVDPPDGSVMRSLLTGLRDVIAALRRHATVVVDQLAGVDENVRFRLPDVLADAAD